MDELLKAFSSMSIKRNEWESLKQEVDRLFNGKALQNKLESSDIEIIKENLKRWS
ncbi:MAG: hypothetical protein WBA84_10100 [Carnobacterium sp.]|uniref:hypothetical protein n=1 Tax=Carnobacterium sp. TaxID=48221 RepID=UPI003C74BD52